jgi:hypothetical protein
MKGDKIIYCRDQAVWHSSKAYIQKLSIIISAGTLIILNVFLVYFPQYLQASSGISPSGLDGFLPSSLQFII